MNPHTPTAEHSLSDRVYLTNEGRTWLEGRASLLRGRLEEARRDIADDLETWESGLTTVSHAEAELSEIDWALRRAEPIDELPADPTVVEIGDVVRLRLSNGEEEAYIIVHSAEAQMDESRVSTECPLGRALLGRRVGETVEVVTPQSAYTCTILCASRHNAGARVVADRRRM